MMMSHFVNRIVMKHNEKAERIKREHVAKRRMELSTILSSKNLPQNKFADLKEVNSLFLSRSVLGSPIKMKDDTSIEKSTQVLTERKSILFRDYAKTEKREKN